MYLNIEILDLEIQFFQKLAYLGANFFNVYYTCKTSFNLVQRIIIIKNYKSRNSKNSNLFE